MAKKTSRKGGKKGARRASKSRTSSQRSASDASSEADDGSAAPGDDDGIEPADLSALEDGKLYYRIGEVSQITGVKPYVLRYWESEFRLMAPQKSRSKQRLYRQKDIETILAIKHLLYEERYTIAGARKRLREMGGEARALLVARLRGTGDPPEAGAAASTVVESYRRIRDDLLQVRRLLAADA